MARFVYSYTDMCTLRENLQNNVASLEEARVEAEERKQQFKEDLAQIKQSIVAAQADIDTAEQDIQRAETDLSIAQDALASAQAAYDAISSPPSTASDEEKAAAAAAKAAAGRAVSEARAAVATAEKALAEAKKRLEEAQRAKQVLEESKAELEKAAEEFNQTLKDLKQCIEEYTEAIACVENTMQQTWDAQAIAANTLVKLAFDTVIKSKYHAGDAIGREIVNASTKVEEDFTWATVNKGTAKNGKPINVYINLESLTNKGTKEAVEQGLFTKGGLKALSEHYSRIELLGICVRAGVSPSWYQEVFADTPNALREGELEQWTAAYADTDLKEAWINHNSNIWGHIKVDVPWDRETAFYCQMGGWYTDGGGKACLATSCATTFSLVLGYNVTPLDVTSDHRNGSLVLTSNKWKDKNGAVYEVHDTGVMNGQQEYMLQTIATALKNGAPGVTIYLNNHAVTVTDIAPGADINNITSLKDLMVVDPYYNAYNEGNAETGHVGKSSKAQNDVWSNEVNLYDLCCSKDQNVYGFTIRRVITLDPVLQYA